MTHVLAHQEGIRIFIALLVHRGALCPKCAFGTRVVSKKWAKCKKCGDRIERRKMP
jgi:tRNA(Ile2) C34 agmatinyltransferase TiaS